MGVCGASRALRIRRGRTRRAEVAVPARGRDARVALPVALAVRPLVIYEPSQNIFQSATLVIPFPIIPDLQTVLAMTVARLPRRPRLLSLQRMGQGWVPDTSRLSRPSPYVHHSIPPVVERYVLVIARRQQYSSFFVSLARIAICHSLVITPQVTAVLSHTSGNA